MSEFHDTGKCGTYTGATLHYRRFNEKPCPKCREARNQYARRKGRERGEEPDFAYTVIRQYVTGVTDLDFKCEALRGLL